MNPIILFVSLLLIALFINYFVFSFRYRVQSVRNIGEKRPPWLPYAIPMLGHSFVMLISPYNFIKQIK